jgi:hypothetical protein
MARIKILLILSIHFIYNFFPDCSRRVMSSTGSGRLNK